MGFDSKEFQKRLRSRSRSLAKVRATIREAVESECRFPYVRHIGTTVIPHRFDVNYCQKFLLIHAQSHVALLDDSGAFVTLSSFGGNMFCWESTVDELSFGNFWKTGWDSITEKMKESAKSETATWMEDPRRIVAKKGRKKRA